MRKIIFLLLFCISIYAKENHTEKDTTVASEIVLLNDAQKKILYEFSVLQQNSSDAAYYWLKHKNQFPAFNDSLRDKLANEVFINSNVLYKPAKNSSVQLWMQAQSFTNWMLYAAAFIAICAVIGLLRNYWNLLIDVLIRQFAPLFRLLFSAILLTYELLLIGIACIAFGYLIEDMFMRTIVIHIGLFLLWSQSTAIFTKKYLVHKYIFEINNNFWKNDKWLTVKTICFPAIIVSIALLYVLYKVPNDTFYNYEIVVSVLATICAMPFWRTLEKYISPLLIPFKDEQIERAVYSLAACTVLALLILGLLIGLLNPIFLYIITALTILLIISFLILSLKINFRNRYQNYYYQQLITTAFLAGTLFYGFQAKSGEIIWVSLVGISVFAVIKYWEIPTFFNSWKKRNTWTWGFLGMAVLLWLLAKGILYVSQVLYAG